MIGHFADLINTLVKLLDLIHDWQVDPPADLPLIAFIICEVSESIRLFHSFTPTIARFSQAPRCRNRHHKKHHKNASRVIGHDIGITWV